MGNLESFTKEYYYNWGDALITTTTRDREKYEGVPQFKSPTKEELLKKVEEYIEKNDIQSDDEYVYLCKATNLDGKDKDGNDFMYYPDKTFATNDGITVYTYEDALKRCKENSYFPLADHFHCVSFHLDITYSEPTDPSILKKETSKIFKVKVRKSDIIIINDCVIKTKQLEVIEEVSLEPTLKYTIQSLTEVANGFKYIFKIENSLTGKAIMVDFISNEVGLSQGKIKDKISKRIKLMQEIYDEFEASNGELGE